MAITSKRLRSYSNRQYRVSVAPCDHLTPIAVLHLVGRGRTEEARRRDVRRQIRNWINGLDVRIALVGSGLQTDAADGGSGPDVA